MYAVSLDHVWKRYHLGEGRGILDLLRRAERPAFWSLSDLNLHVEAGESVGLIGHNGAGKTTTLKLLAGISRPTRGQVRTQGRVASLINLGAGFHRELTGRENVYLNGVILGLSRREVRERFDEIVDFAEIGDYIDTPVKQYSTGMYARLGFAVAVHVDPEVLLVDEVLSVGDVSFQEKSIRKMLSFRDRGCSILFVSHNLSAVEMMCQRAVWLDHGTVRLQGPASDVVRAYLEAVDEDLVASSGDWTEDADAQLGVREVTLHDAVGQLTTDFEYGDRLVVRLHCQARADLREVSAQVTVRGDYGPLFTADSREGGQRYEWSRGSHGLECEFESLPVLPGLYRVEVLLSHRDSPSYQAPQTLAAFRVNTDLACFGSTSIVGVTKSRGGFLAVPYNWRLTTLIGTQPLAGLTLPTS